MSTISAASSTTSSSSASSGSSSTSSVSSQSLTEDDFLNLLVKQITTQDPMNPQSDTDFIAQLAQFSALEESKTMESDLSKLNTTQQTTQASSYLGKTVSITSDDGTTTSGVVSSIDLSGSTPQIVVNGTSYDISNVTSVSSATSSSTTSSSK
jgi:flagellar basal-body rod modification protein FlgD